MVRRKLDNRIKILIDNGVTLGHRTVFAVVGEKGRDQVGYIHQMISRASLKQIDVLWCYKNDLPLSSNRRKRALQVKAQKEEKGSANLEDDPFEVFVSTTNIRYAFYRDSHKLLGNTYKMCVLQDFEALTPNILCRTLETVEGGGAIVILLQSVTSLKQLYTLSMDVHARYRTESHQNIVPRFNERFMLSLSSCTSCIFIDDQMRVLPISSHLKDIEPLPPRDKINNLSPAEIELKQLRDSTKGTQPLGTLIALCKTLDQARVVLKFIMLITGKTLNTTVSLTAARGRGKSAAMGIALAGAIAFGYSNIYVTSPAPQNLTTLFDFVIKTLKALNYEDVTDFKVLRSEDEESEKAVVRITVTRDQHQLIQYISPSEADVLGMAELLVIDEAAAIPLPLVRSLLGPYLVFLSSTVCGYEGTGRSLSLKLLKQLRDKQVESENDSKARKLVELTLEEPIRYKVGDKVEKWLLDLLCLDTKLPKVKDNVSPPENCKLYYINKDTLFSYHQVSEKILSATMGLLVSSHYKNSPDDLQILSDAPAHHLFVLLPEAKDHQLPPVLVVIQVALEGKISHKSLSERARGQKTASGDLIPWVMSATFLNDEFPQLSGARVVRIATHPHLQGKGYGSQALTLLEQYYEKSRLLANEQAEHVAPAVESAYTIIDDEQVNLLEEKIEPRSETTPLFMSLEERRAEALHYLGVSFGASLRLVRFWKKLGYTPVICREKPNQLTGEHNILMMKVLGENKKEHKTSWLKPFFMEFRRRLIYLLPGPLKELSSPTAISLLISKSYKNKPQVAEYHRMRQHVNDLFVKRLKAYVNQQSVDDLWSPLAHLYFMDMVTGVKLSALQMTILAGVGLQCKHASLVAKELELETASVMSQLYEIGQMFNSCLGDIWKESQEDHSKKKADSNHNEEQDIEHEKTKKRTLDLEENSKKLKTA